MKPLIDWQPLVPQPTRRGLPPFAVRRHRSNSAIVLIELPLLVVIALAVTFVLKSFVAQAFVIPSESMYPTLKIGDRVVVSRVAYRTHDPNRGDVIVFPNPSVTATDESAFPLNIINEVLEGIGVRQPPEQELIKRIIALPGETIEERGGRVLINGQLLNEPYLQPGVVTVNLPKTVVPEGHVFVMGDNRGDSRDSRVFGTVDQSKIVGRALFRVWPPGRLAFL